MAITIPEVARKLGAAVVGTVPDYSAGAFGVAALAQTLRERLEPGQGKRPGRPSNPSWIRRSKVPIAAETEARLEHLARLLSDERRKVSPMQVAAQLLEDATAQYFVGSGRRTDTPVTTARAPRPRRRVRGTRRSPSRDH